MMTAMQSEIMLVRKFHGNDAAAATRVLTNINGICGLLGLFCNELGGKLSDAYGRMPMFLASPLVTLAASIAVFRDSSSMATVYVCRALRFIFLSFTMGTLSSAALSDIHTGQHFAAAIGQLQATMAVGMIFAPAIEGLILTRTRDPRYTYAMVSFLALGQVLYTLVALPETVDRCKRKRLTLSMNPFGFLNIYSRRTSKALKKLTTCAQMAYIPDAKNMSQILQVWMMDHLQWGVGSIMRFSMAQGLLMVLTGASLTPQLLAKLSPRRYTTITTVASTLGLHSRRRP